MKVSCTPISLLNLGGLRAPLGVAVNTDLHEATQDIQLKISNNYYDAFRRAPGAVFSVTADRYLKGRDESWSDNGFLCPEMPIDRRSAGRLTIKVPGANRGRHAVAFLHAGRRNCLAPLHFDWDHAWVAHACLTGRKRFFFFPPESGWLLNPIINTSSFAVPRFSELDATKFVESVGGIQVTLEAGQGVLFPSLFWHGVAYDEPCLSVSVRFSQPFGARPYSALPRSWFLQRLLWVFFRSGFAEESRLFLAAYLQMFFRRRGWKKRYHETLAFVVDELKRRGETCGLDCWMGENFLSEPCLAQNELQFYYGVRPTSADPEEIKNVQDYLFEGTPKPKGTSEKLAAHALRLRQGLRPQRGFVEVV